MGWVIERVAKVNTLLTGVHNLQGLRWCEILRTRVQRPSPVGHFGRSLLVVICEVTT